MLVWVTDHFVADAVDVFGYHGFHAAVGDSFLRKGGLYGLSGVFTVNDRTTICTLKGGSCVEASTCTGRSQRHFVCTDTSLICCFTPPQVVVKKVFHLREIDDDVKKRKRKGKKRRNRKLSSRRRKFDDHVGAYSDAHQLQQPHVQSPRIRNN